MKAFKNIAVNAENACKYLYELEEIYKCLMKVCTMISLPLVMVLEVSHHI